jgi:hypothetical protein
MSADNAARLDAILQLTSPQPEASLEEARAVR